MLHRIDPYSTVREVLDGTLVADSIEYYKQNKTCLMPIRTIDDVAYDGGELEACVTVVAALRYWLGENPTIFLNILLKKLKSS